MSLKERFWGKVRVAGEDECWEWLGCKNKGGYGVININRSACLAHRVAYELSFGPIHDGLDVLHSCDNPPCCNPAQLFLGTNAVNVDDMIAKGRQPKGESKTQSKLTEAQVLEIRATPKTAESCRTLALKYGVSNQRISAIRTNKVWAHLPPGINDGRGAWVKGKAHHQAKLTEAQVLEIRAAHGPHVGLARNYGVSGTLISKIRNHKLWVHLPVPAWITPSFENIVGAI